MPTSPTDGTRLAAVAPAAPGRTRPRPGWTEIAVGLATLAVITFGSVQIITPASVGPDAFGLFLTTLSFLAAGGGFAAAAEQRARVHRAPGAARTRRVIRRAGRALDVESGRGCTVV